MKVLSIGDVHGYGYWKNHVKNEHDICVFVGDYVDDFDNTSEVIVNNLLDIIEYKKNNIDKVILLLGNHDIQYMLNHPSVNKLKYSCTGYRLYSHFDLYDIFNDNKLLFQVAYQHKNYLWTHAGIHRGWYEQKFLPHFNKHFKDFNGNIADQLNIAFEHELEPLFYVGYYRGGVKPTGGIFWADYNETKHKGLKDYHQICGHTRKKKITTETQPKFNSSITYIDVQNDYYLIDV